MGDPNKGTVRNGQSRIAGILIYMNTGSSWRDRCMEVFENGYEGFELSSNADAVTTVGARFR